MKIPVACSLEVNDAASRVDEWRAFFVESVSAAAREGTSLKLRLAPSDEALLGAADLAAREKTCCSFFRFAIEVDASGRTLVVQVPDDAVAVLDGFVELLPEQARPQ